MFNLLNLQIIQSDYIHVLKLHNSKVYVDFLLEHNVNTKLGESFCYHKMFQKMKIYKKNYNYNIMKWFKKWFYKSLL